MRVPIGVPGGLLGLGSWAGGGWGLFALWKMRDKGKGGGVGWVGWVGWDKGTGKSMRARVCQNYRLAIFP